MSAIIVVIEIVYYNFEYLLIINISSILDICVMQENIYFILLKIMS